MDEEKQISLQRFLEEDKPFHCRLNHDEKKYLYQYWNCKFSEYVHNCFKRDMELEKKNTRINRFQSFNYAFIMIGIGLVFFFYSTLQNSGLLGWLMTFLLGVFFVVTGVVNAFVEVLKLGR